MKREAIERPVHLLAQLALQLKSKSIVADCAVLRITHLQCDERSTDKTQGRSAIPGCMPAFEPKLSHACISRARQMMTAVQQAILNLPWTWKATWKLVSSRSAAGLLRILELHWNMPCSSSPCCTNWSTTSVTLGPDSRGCNHKFGLPIELPFQILSIDQ